MIHVEPRRVIHLVLRATGCLATIALLSSPVLGLWSDAAWGQQPPLRLTPLAQKQAELKRRPNPKPTQDAQPSAAKPVSPVSTPIDLLETDPSSPLGRELESCDNAEVTEPVSLPGAKGEIKLDRCYRGRDPLVCGFRALSSEAKLLLENYRKIVDANYPELGSVDDVCKIEPDNLATDTKNAIEFMGRFKAFKAQYDARLNCANKIGQSLRDVTLPDMTQAPAMLKSMIDSIEGDIKGVSAAQSQVVEFSERINSSHKALLTIHKIHQTMCGRHQIAKTDDNAVSSSGSPGLSPGETLRAGTSPTPPAAFTKPPATPRYFVVINPVGECAVINTKPADANAVGNGGGYSSFMAAKGAANAAKAKCRRVVE